METLSINQKINVRSNKKATTRSFETPFWHKNNILTAYNVAIKNIELENKCESLKNDLCLNFAVMPFNTQKQLLVNLNFQRSYK